MAIDPGVFLSTMGNVAASVTVVTTYDGDEPQGLTVSAFSSVSLDPPLVLACVGNESTSLPALRAHGGFSVSFLAEGAAEEALIMASKELPKFSLVPHRAPANPIAGPILEEHSFAYFECETTDLIQAGDHVVLIGRVIAARHLDGRPPLVWFRKTFVEISDPRQS
ncbi:MAG: flavin reductase family protein [Acidimicrobiia bacterium]|nr:flavin reductase family protein [Acidimicrobiia bacterium]